MRDEPDADAVSPRGQVRLFTMVCAVRLRSRRAAAEVKTNVLRIADRPVAAFRVKRDDRGGGRAQAGEGGHLGARGGGLLWLRLDGRERLRRGAATYRGGGDGGGGLLDLGSRYRPLGQQAQHKSGAARGGATVIPPASHAPLADVEPPSDVREARRAERRAELGRGR